MKGHPKLVYLPHHQLLSIPYFFSYIIIDKASFDIAVAYQMDLFLFYSLIQQLVENILFRTITAKFWSKQVKFILANLDSTI
jgi:hypothetical protein